VEIYLIGQRARRQATEVFTGRRRGPPTMTTGLATTLLQETNPYAALLRFGERKGLEQNVEENAAIYRGEEEEQPYVPESPSYAIPLPYLSPTRAVEEEELEAKEFVSPPRVPRRRGGPEPRLQVIRRRRPARSRSRSREGEEPSRRQRSRSRSRSTSRISETDFLPLSAVAMDVGPEEEKEGGGPVGLQAPLSVAELPPLPQSARPPSFYRYTDNKRRSSNFWYKQKSRVL